MTDINKLELNRQIQESRVLNAELSHLRLTTKLYERHVPSSNIFFLTTDVEALKIKSLDHQKELEKQLK